MLLTFLVSVSAAFVGAQQVPDTAFHPPIPEPAFPPQSGPAVLLDEGHFNFHTSAGRYRPFAELLRRDGYVVMPSTKPFAADVLRVARVLVVSNALNERNEKDWSPPNPPAFTPIEVATVRDWVSAGGALLLIADHKPFVGAAEALGRAFGVRFLDGSVRRKDVRGPIVFRKADGTLMDHPITKGIDEVATFTGSSFQMDAAGQPLLVLGPETYSFADQDDPRPVPVSGHLQGAVLPFGQGKVAVFGEAAMFSAQLAGPNRVPMGMNAPTARQNAQFLLNVVHWLTGVS